MVLRGYQKSVGAEHLRKIRIASHMFRDSVHQLHDCLRLSLRLPDNAVDFSTAGGSDFQFLHG